MKIGERVTIRHPRAITPEDFPKAVIKDVKWNMVLVKFDDGTEEWVRDKWVSHDAIPR